MPKVAAFFGNDKTMDDALEALYKEDTFDDDHVTIVRTPGDQTIQGAVDATQGSKKAGVVHPPEGVRDYDVVFDLRDRLTLEGITEEEAKFFARHLKDGSGAVVVVDVDDNGEGRKALEIFNNSQATVFED